MSMTSTPMQHRETSLIGLCQSPFTTLLCLAPIPHSYSLPYALNPYDHHFGPPMVVVMGPLSM